MNTISIQQVMTDRGTHSERMWEMFLWSLVHLDQPKVVVEIGTGNGASTQAITTAMYEIRYGVDGTGYDHNSSYEGRLYSVDFSVHVKHVFDRLEERGLSEFITRIHDYSDKAGPKFTLPIDILIIDADHYYNSVLTDWVSWEDKVVEAGYIVFHDMTIKEVDDAFLYLVNESDYQSIILGDGLHCFGVMRKLRVR